MTLLHRKHNVFRGKPPVIPDAVEAVEGDDNPMTITALVMREGDIMSRGVYVTRALMSQCAQQLPSVMIVGSGLWAKIYVPPGEKRERLRQTLRRNGSAQVLLNGQMVGEALTCLSVSIEVGVGNDPRKS